AARVACARERPRVALLLVSVVPLFLLPASEHGARVPAPPLRYTAPRHGAHSSSGLGHRPLTAAARVRIPYGPFLPAGPPDSRWALGHGLEQIGLAVKLELEATRTIATLARVALERVQKGDEAMVTTGHA